MNERLGQTFLFQQLSRKEKLLFKQNLHASTQVHVIRP